MAAGGEIKNKVFLNLHLYLIRVLRYIKENEKNKLPGFKSYLK